VTEQQQKLALAALERHLADVKKAYHQGQRGYTYDDMAAAAERVLRMRIAIEKASGRAVKTKLTRRAIADLLR
jgi:hypothetical protein